jgi:hypothetical protein
MGIFCRAMKVPKVMHQFLNTVGFCTSYQTTGVWLRANAASDRAVLSAAFRTTPIGVCWDNLVRFDKKAEETIMNQGSKLQQNTSALMFPLSIPEPPHRSSLAEFVIYDNIMRTIKDFENESIGALPRSLLLKDVDYATLDVKPMEFLNKDLLVSHIPQIATELVSEVLELLCGKAAMNTFKDQNDGCLQVPVVGGVAGYLKLEPKKSDFHTCPTMGIDETTLDGTAMIYEKLLEYVNVESTELQDKIVLTYGDQLTWKNIAALKDMRIREAKADRLEFATPKAGFFHMSMANIDAVVRCNWGSSGAGYDPSCLSRFVAVLGRSGISQDGGDFNAKYRLVDHVLSGYVAAALMTQASALAGRTIKSPTELRSWVEQNDWLQLVEKVVTYYFAFGRVAYCRSAANDQAVTEYETKRADIMNKNRRERTAAEVKFLTEAGRKSFVDSHTAKNRDRVLENAILFMIQALIAVDFHQSMRRGEVGRLEADMKVMMINFHGCGKSKYARLLLERQFDQHFLWTDEYHYIDIRNNLLNQSGRSGKFLAIDETLELVNADLQSGYNPRDTWQSLDWHRTVVSPNIIPFRKMKDSILKSSGTTTGGKRHSRPDSRADILRIMDMMLKEDVLRLQKGRWAVGPAGAKVAVRESLDMFDQGSATVLFGGVVEAIVESRRCSQLAVPEVPELNADEWVEELDDCILAWNEAAEALRQDDGERQDDGDEQE